MLQGDNSGNITRKGLTHMAWHTYMKVAGFTHVGHMPVKCDSKTFDCG